MIEATKKQLELLWHTLGISPGCRASDRNYFLTSPGYDDASNLDLLVKAGLATRCKAPAFCDPEDVVYRVTPEGKQFAISKLPPPPHHESTPSSMLILMSASATTVANFRGINHPQIQQSGDWGVTSTAWFRVPGTSTPYEIRVLVALRGARSCRRLGVNHEGGQGELQGCTQAASSAPEATC